MRNLTTALLVSALGLTASVSAQQSGLVNVNLGNVNVLNDLAKNLSVDVKNIPVTVQVPVGVAANICNISANVLAKQLQQGAAKCNAASNSTALTQIVQKAVTKKNTDTGNTTTPGGTGGTAGTGATNPGNTKQSGLVNLNLGNVNVLNDLAKNLSVDVKNIPVTVQVPVNVAANVCNISANVLAKQVRKGTASCAATSNSAALTQIVQKAMTNTNTDTGNTTNTGGTGGTTTPGGTTNPGNTTQSGLVNVNLGNVNILNNLAKNLSVDVENIPVTVQVPVNVAANICNISANVLAQQLQKGAASCDAAGNSAALTQIVQKAMTNTDTDTNNK